MKKLCIVLFAIILTHVTYAQSKAVIKCELWNPESFCNIPDSIISIPNIIKIDSGQVTYTTCEKIDKKRDMTGVWLTLSKKNGTILMLESDFENISLIKKSDGNKLHPYAILWSDGYDNNGEKKLQYMTSDFKTSSYKAKFAFQKKIDLILIFSIAKIGDKIIINDFVETEIQK